MVRSADDSQTVRDRGEGRKRREIVKVILIPISPLLSCRKMPPASAASTARTTTALPAQGRIVTQTGNGG